VKKLYVGNIPWTMTEDQVKAYFSTIGEVKSVNIITDRETGKSRGFCFVEMENADEAITQLNGKDYEGRPLKINEAKEREPRSGGSGGGGGGKGGGGYGRGGYGRDDNRG
jgi:RNA recognition motif-containing protein